MKAICTLLSLLATFLYGAESGAPGVKVGSKIPDFSAPDQNGTPRDFAAIAGSKGAVLVFYRSADW